MPTPRKHPKLYDDKHYAILANAHKADEPMVLPFLSTASAKQYRMFLYTMRKCVLEHPEWNPTMTAIMKDLRLRIEGKSLVIEKKDTANVTNT